MIILNALELEGQGKKKNMRQPKCTVGHLMCEIHIGLEVCQRRTWWSNWDRWEPMCAVYGTSQLTGRRRQ